MCFLKYLVKCLSFKFKLKMKSEKQWKALVKYQLYIWLCLSKWFKYNQTFHWVMASTSSSSWTKVCVILLIPLSCCLPEQLVSNVFKTHVQLIKRMERLKKHLSLKRWVLLKVGYIRLLYLSTVSSFNLITWLIEISQGRTFLIQMLHLGIYILENLTIV